MCDKDRLYEDIDYVTEEAQSGEYVNFPRERGFVFPDGSVVELSWGEDHRIIGQWDECNIVTYSYSGGEADIRVNGRITIPQKSILIEWLEVISPSRIVIDYYRGGEYVVGKTFEFVKDAKKFLNKIYYDKVKGGVKMASVRRIVRRVTDRKVSLRKKAAEEEYLNRRVERSLRAKWRDVSNRLRHITTTFRKLEDKYENNKHNSDFGTSKWTWEFNVKFLDRVDYPAIVDEVPDNVFVDILNVYTDGKFEEFEREVKKIPFVKYYIDEIGTAGRSGGWLILVDNMADELDEYLCSVSKLSLFGEFFPNPECKDYDYIDNVVKRLKDGEEGEVTLEDVEAWYEDVNALLERWEDYINEAEAGLDAVSDLVDKYLNQMIRELESEKFWRQYVEKEE